MSGPNTLSRAAEIMQFDDITHVRWSSSDEGDRFTVENPATGTVITTVQGCDADSVDRAVKAARGAFVSTWRATTPRERSDYLLRCADVLEAHADELSELESRENGKPILDARPHDVGFLINIFRYFGGVVDKMPSELFDKGTIYTQVHLEPDGVVGAIIPFNWPPIHTGGKVAAALAVGNTVVVKPSEQAPLTIMRIVELCNSVLPADVLHVVPGLAAAGEAISSHSLVNKITFTGSTKAGSAVAAAAAVNITPTTLELGGKNPFIVFDDADLDRALRDALDGGYYNKGEACTAASRVLVQRGVYDEFVRRHAAGVKALKVGHGADPTTAVGPVVSRHQRDIVTNYIEIGREEGARVAAQAALPDDPDLADGFWVAPTLFADVTRDMRIAQEEIFGPVQTITVFDTEDEAISIANESEYGLLAGVYSGDMARALRVARRLENGMVLVNNYNREVIGDPFGGVKHSGYGREHTLSTLQDFGQPKMIRIPSGLGAIPYWRAVDEIYGESGSEVKTDS